MVIAKKQYYKVPELIKKAYQAGEKYMDVSVIIDQFSDYLSTDLIFNDTPEIVSVNNQTIEPQIPNAYHA